MANKVDSSPISSAGKAIEYYNKFVKSGKNPLGLKDSKGQAEKRQKQRREMAVNINTFTEWSKKVLQDGVIKTGLPELDEASGVGGFPRGKMIELFGTESVVKVTLVIKQSHSVNEMVESQL